MPASSAHSRARQLARHGTLDRPMPALVCPLVLAQAAEIEALPAGQFLTDPTKLANGLRALHGAFGTDVIVTAAADDLAAAAAGAAGDLPAAVTGHPRVAAAVEATRRLAATAEDAVLAAALCGPAQLAAQLGRPPDPAALEGCGAALLALAKAFLEAGAHLLLVVEAEPVSRPAAGGWHSAVTPLVNVARFRQAAAAVVLADLADAALAPRGAVVCLPPAAAGPGQGIALDTDPAAWSAPPTGAPLITTLGPVRGGFAECRAAVGQLTAALAEG
ncbi:MAG TPA: hypothetical protein VIY52_31995 [Streptosporangiaceae bacterium]